MTSENEPNNVIGVKRRRELPACIYDYYFNNIETSCFLVNMKIDDPIDTKIFNEAMKSQESNLWLNVMKDELDSMEKNKV